jgi:hypothetical protein
MSAVGLDISSGVIEFVGGLCIVTSFAAGNSVKGCAEHETPILYNTYKTDVGDAVDAAKLLDDFLVQLTVS